MLDREGALVVEHRCELQLRGSLLTWYTAQPDPSHWVAVGSTVDCQMRGHCTPHVYIGVGPTEAAATRDLLATAAPENIDVDPESWAVDEWIAEWSL